MPALDGNPLNAAAAIGVEMEKLKPTVYAQFQQDDTFLSRLGTTNSRNDLEVSQRLCRFSVLVQPGATFGQFFPDGTTDSMGTGGGSVYDVGVATPVYFVQSCQVTKEAEWATKGDSRAIVDVFKNEFKVNLKQFRSNLEGLVAASDGSGTLATVTATPGGGATSVSVSNANNFQAGCTYQDWSALGGTNRGSFVVLSVDSVNNILFLTAVVPTGMASGDVLLVAGASGSATQSFAPDRYTTATIAASLNGVPAINFSSNTGSWFGIPRTTYPAIFNTPTVNVAGALTPAVLLQLQSYMQRALGVEGENWEEAIVQANVDQVTAWESIGLVTTTGVGTAFVPQEGQKGGDERMDYLKKNRIQTIAGHELMTNIKAQQGRLDLICLKHWFRIETKPVALFDIDGATIFPLYGSDGGVAPTSAFYFVTGMQLATDLARAGGYLSNLSLPTGF